MSRKHSRFAPSALHRILACPKSVALAEQAIEVEPTRSRASSYAAEGTAAHDVAAAYLEGKTVPPLVGSIIETDGFAITIDADMHSHARAYAAYVRAQMEEKGSQLIVEEVVDLDDIVGHDARMYGHLDAATWSLMAGQLDVVDYKYGAGIPVSPAENPQLMAYALGALHRLKRGDRHMIHFVSLHVFQPRIDNGAAAWSIAAVDLELWGQDVLKPVIRSIVDGDELPDYATGDHCRFCPALSICPAWAAKVDAEAQAVFAMPIENVPADALGHALARLRALAPYIDGVETEVKRRLVDVGDAVPGFKPVVSQWRRFWSNGANPREIAAALDLKPADVMTAPELGSPAFVEKKLSKSDRGKLDSLVVRKPYGVSIVAADDPRPDIRPGIDDVKH